MCQSRMLQAMKKLSKTTNVEIEMVNDSNDYQADSVSMHFEKFLLPHLCLPSVCSVLSALDALELES